MLLHLLAVSLAWKLVASKGPTEAISTVVAFGDSFSDTGIWPDTIWPEYLSTYMDIPVHSFAKAGATCSNALTPRIWPDVVLNETSVYRTEKEGGRLGTLDPANTLYTLWIGTNDVGAGCLLTGDQKPGVTIVETTECAVGWIKSMYDSGARNFLFQQMVPLQRIPMYKKDAYLTTYWRIPNNMTEFSIFMESEVRSGNKISSLLLKDLATELDDAHIGIFDSYGLFTDILDHPEQYLNGSAPFNTTGAIVGCPYAPNSDAPLYCTVAPDSDVDSYVWYDELHPSNQTHRIVAKEITSMLKGESSTWGTWLS